MTEQNPFDEFSSMSEDLWRELLAWVRRKQKASHVIGVQSSYRFTDWFIGWQERGKNRCHPVPVPSPRSSSVRSDNEIDGVTE